MKIEKVKYFKKLKEIKDNITICTTEPGCDGCSLFHITGSINCRNKLLSDALFLINELENLCENLQDENYKFYLFFKDILLKSKCRVIEDKVYFEFCGDLLLNLSKQLGIIEDNDYEK